MGSRTPRRGGRALQALRLGSVRFWAQNMPHHAAALTYYSVLALFQAMIVGVALLGLLGTRETLDDLAQLLARLGADQRLIEGLVAAARDAVTARGTSAVALVAGVLLALVVASSAFVAAAVALNVVLEADDPRPFGRRWLDAIRGTAVVLLLGTGSVVAIFLGGTLAEEVFDALGPGDHGAAIWEVVRVPVAAVLAMTTFAWMYYSAPAVPNPRWRWISFGALVAVVVWLLASLGLFAYATSSGSFDSTFGSFATAVLLLVWLWITNAALLLGAEVNAAGRFVEGVQTPLSRTGDPPEAAQHRAARAPRP
jgi:membrane protein